jgi:hypothetical protein
VVLSHTKSFSAHNAEYDTEAAALAAESIGHGGHDVVTHLRSRYLLVCATLLLAVVGCANPSIHRVNAERLANTGIKRIFVPRFEGNPNFVEEGTDYFITALQAQLAIDIVQGDSLRKEGEDIASGSNIAATDIAIAAAKRRGTDAVILGKVTSHKTAGTLNGFSTIRLISVREGEILASFHRPSGLLFAHSEHQTVMAAVKRTADDMAQALLDARTKGR